MSNGMSSIPESEVYRTLMSIVTATEQLRWTRLNAFLVVSSIFMAAWAVIFVRTPFFCGKSILLAVVCLPGLVLGPIWSFLTCRTSRDLDRFHDAGLEMEKQFPSNLPRPFHISQRSRERTARGWRKLTSSKVLVTAIPVLLSLIFLVLCIASLTLATKF